MATEQTNPGNSETGENGRSPVAGARLTVLPEAPATRRLRPTFIAPRPAWRGWRILGPLLLLCTCSALFVGSDVLERQLLPDLTTGWRHGLLTARSAIAVGVGSAIVYLLMRRQQRRLRSQMVEKEKMVAIGQMAAGIAHEIGNPLSSISSIVQMLKRKGALHPQSEQLDLIQAHIQRISATVRQLAGLARPTSEHWEHVDLGPTLEEAVRLVSFDGRARRVKMDFTPPAALPPTYAVRGQIQQVFINILLNALDAMPDGGTLSVRAEHHPWAIRFRFEDTGCGIPAAIGRRVFEPFYTTKEPGRGTGLGLAVSYGIMQKHGGTIDFAARNGGGTVFSVEVPVLTGAPDR